MDFQKTLNADRDILLHGFPASNNALNPRHPVELAEQNYVKQQQDMQFELLKRTQGIHAPLRMMMERKLASNVGRLPFLKSSNLMLEILEGKQEHLEFRDFLKDPMESEVVASPQLVMEKKLGLL